MGFNEFSPKDARQSIASITNTEGQYGRQYGYPKASCLRLAENLAKTNGNQWILTNKVWLGDCAGQP